MLKETNPVLELALWNRDAASVAIDWELEHGAPAGIVGFAEYPDLIRQLIEVRAKFADDLTPEHELIPLYQLITDHYDWHHDVYLIRFVRAVCNFDLQEGLEFARSMRLTSPPKLLCPVEYYAYGAVKERIKTVLKSIQSTVHHPDIISYHIGPTSSGADEEAALLFIASSVFGRNRSPETVPEAWDCQEFLRVQDMIREMERLEIP